VPAVVAGEFAAGEVEGEAPLAAADFRANLEIARVEGIILPTQFEGRVAFAGEVGQAARVATERAVNALIGTPLEEIGQRLHVEFVCEIAKPGGHERVHIGVAVALGVLEIKQVR